MTQPTREQIENVKELLGWCEDHDQLLDLSALIALGERIASGEAVMVDVPRNYATIKAQRILGYDTEMTTLAWDCGGPTKINRSVDVPNEWVIKSSMITSAKEE
jgi:hypothetical protein